MLELLATTSVRQSVVIAAFGTRFMLQLGAQSRSILPAISTIDGKSAEDVNGFGNSVTHLLAALLGENRASVLPIKVRSNNGAGSLCDILEGYLKAVENNGGVLAILLGGGGKIRQTVRYCCLRALSRLPQRAIMQRVERVITVR